MPVHFEDAVSVKAVAVSISPQDILLPTLHLRYPRLIHSEFMTHRATSKNGRSSRAVPVLTLAKEEPYLPHFMKNRKGMQATEELDPQVRLEAERIWLEMAEVCRSGVLRLAELDVHKQHANRPLEWFGFIDVLMTTTDIANFMALRDHKDAQPEIRDLAQRIKEVLDKAAPKLLLPGEWHLPYVSEGELKDLRDPGNFGDDGLNVARILSAARCARISYKPFDGDSSIEAEMTRYAQLVESRPVHASPVEHQATPDTMSHYDVLKIENDGCDELLTFSGMQWDNRDLHGNFTGWIQNRQLIPHHVVVDKHYYLAGDAPQTYQDAAE